MPQLCPSSFRDLISGRRHGPGAALLRAGLRLAEVPYTWAVRWRNHRYATGKAAVHRVGVPVISVGNLTLGGTGKTPMVRWLAQWFAGRGVVPILVSRGYGAREGRPNDEAMELAWDLPDVPHLQNPDRVAAARRAIEQFPCGVLLLDDGFQHRRIGRDLDLVLLDALEPFGFDHVFPRGTLREPAEGLSRADVVALSRADLLPSARRQEIRRRVEGLAPRAQWLEIAQVPQALVSTVGEEQPLDALPGQRVLAFCGIGNPAGFRHTLSRAGYEVATVHEFPDHHGYDRRDLEALAAAAGNSRAAAILCTHKDLVKLVQLAPPQELRQLGGRPLWAVRIGLKLLAGREAFEARLAAVTA